MRCVEVYKTFFTLLGSLSVATSSQIEGRMSRLLQDNQEFELVLPEEQIVLEAQQVELKDAREHAPLDANEPLATPNDTKEPHREATSSAVMSSQQDPSDFEALALEAESLVKELRETLTEESNLLAQLDAKFTAISREASPSINDTESTDIERATSQNRLLRAATWNMAAINNNPFEYWVTYEGDEGEAYMELMEKVSTLLDRGPNDDELVTEVFSREMFDELLQSIVEAQLVKDDENNSEQEVLDQVREYWTNDLSKRTIVDGFLKDATLGKKRLVSMPDRVTNTIRLADGGVATRPTVINCFRGKLPDRESWWDSWKQFMFGERLNVPSGATSSDTGSTTGMSTESSVDGDHSPNFQEAISPAKMLVPISRSKYPDVTPEEEKISVPLTAVTVAIFDAILLHVMLETGVDWEPIRSNMCRALNEQKNPRTAEILENDNVYGSKLDVLFLQESSQAFADLATTRRLGLELFDIHVPDNRDPSRDQNSLILTKKGAWQDVEDVSAVVAQRLQDEIGNGGKIPIAPGDLAVFRATRVLDERKYVLASFHGDTNGLATKPVIDIVHSYIESEAKGASLLFGLDANTHFDQSNPTTIAYVGDFLANLQHQDMTSCYGLDPATLEYTTFNARTYLQPQLNKAVKAAEKNTSPLVDRNPKDFIIFYDHDFKIETNEVTQKDNTGTGDFIKGIVFPTFDFPSDHAISRVTLVAF